MSTASNRSQHPHRRLNSSRSIGRPRAASRAAPSVGREDAYAFALRAAFLHHVLQPKAKRKQYVPAPRAPPRQQTGVAQLVAEFAPGGHGSTSLPKDFQKYVESRIQAVVMGTEKLPGYNDAAVKRSFGEAFVTLTAHEFRRFIEAEKKKSLEPYVLRFYSSAHKASMRGRSPTDDSWKSLTDRHTALFVRLLASILRERGYDRSHPELLSRMQSLEGKLLTNDQDLAQDGGGTTVEVVVPPSQHAKDMRLVQIVSRIFGVPIEQAQHDIDANREAWTEEAALRDLKSYQSRLNSNSGGTLGSRDFDVEDAFEEWKKSEAQHLSQMMLDLLTAKPELAKKPTSSLDIPGSSGRPRSMYGDDQAYADLSRAIMADDDSGLPFDHSLSFSALAIDSPSTIRNVDEANYTFIPFDPRAFYKTTLHYAMTYDNMTASPDDDYQPLTPQSLELLAELSVRWRVPQSSRIVTFVEVVVAKFLDNELRGEELDSALEFIKTPAHVEPAKKSPHIQHYTESLQTLHPARWVLHDYAAYQQSLSKLHGALLRDLYSLMLQCYDTKNPSIGVVMHNLENHVRGDPAFSPNQDEIDDFSNSLASGLKSQAEAVYRGYIDKHLPADTEEWNFLHVVDLGKAVTKLCERIKKRYSKNPVIMAVNPLTILVETMFPSFEEDAKAIVERITQVAEATQIQVHVQDGFDLYRELVAIRRIHQTSLPSRPFAFDIEELLINFVWRLIQDADSTLQERIEEAIKLDPFQVRSEDPDAIPEDSQRHSSSIMDVFTLFSSTINIVKDLEWENEVHHARFMTALSKSFAAGIGRYCEVVEQRFTKEMDRPSAQEQAMSAKSKTTQERFFQYAKDAWATKEKPEPFQFYPESFVKLNNIEFAMHQLDKLEEVMNVDECASILDKVDGPKKQVRKPTNYVFTFKIVEGEDLKACDPSGTSDPYVILGDEYKKRLHKTRIVYRNLNPRWDESVDIATTGATTVIATVWDYDVFGEHDCVGRTSLKLDPNHYSDYLPRELWLDLDTQGRILVRVSMEGERDDIQFHFGKAFRYLKRTERDMVRKITDKLSTQINEVLSMETLRSLLKTTGPVASVATILWKKNATTTPTSGPGELEFEQALEPLYHYFNENFAIMNESLTRATMHAVMARLWKEVLMVIEGLLLPPLSEKPSTQRPLTQRELDVVYTWLTSLYEFFNVKDDHGVAQGVPADVLCSPKWLELRSLNFFYFDDTQGLIRESERIAANNAQKTQDAIRQSGFQSNRLSAPPTLGASLGVPSVPFASMGTIRRGKSVMMSRNLGTMRRVKEEKRKEAQAEQNDDMILRILRMRPEAAGFLKERHRQKERQAATAAAAMIVKNSVNQGWNSNMASLNPYGRDSLMPKRR